MYTGDFRFRSPETMEDCLHGVLHSAGWGFKMGLIGGSTFHFLKSLCSSPTHVLTACHAVRLNAPDFGGKAAAWCALYSASHDGLVFVRQKNDPWNRVFAPAISSGVLSLCRRSLRASACFTMFGALFGTVHQLGSIMLSKVGVDFMHEIKYEESSIQRCDVVGRN